MKIFVTKGEGHGQTLMASFDDSLKQAGVYNYNLIRLSSIIPPKSQVIIGKSRPIIKDEFGWRLYTVYADARTAKPGSWAGAVIAWIQFPDGRGLFTEHENIGSNGKKLEKDLVIEAKKTIHDLCKLRGFDYTEDKVKVVSSVSQAKKGVCADALVIASYQARPWD